MSIDARITKHLPPTADSPAFDLQIHLKAPPAITVLFGPSGSGKTLTLNCVAGFARPDEGRILLNNRLLFDHGTNVHVPPQRRRCGYLFQDHALFPHMTVRENLLFAATVSRTGKRGLAQRRLVNELLEAFELAELAGRMPSQLSGGQKQRAALARILVTEPDAVLLDEPTRGLDARLKQSFSQVLRGTRERLNSPMLLVTHDLDECFQIAEYVCLVDKGKFLQAGPAEHVLMSPVTAEAARLLGIFSLVPGEIRALDPVRNSSRIVVENQEIEARYLPGHLLGDRGLVCLREADLEVSAIAGKLVAGTLVLAVNAAAPSPQGMRLQLQGGISVVVGEALYERELRGEARVQVRIPPSAVSFVAG